MLKSQSAKKVNGTNGVNGASANKNAIQSSIASKKRPAEVSKALTPVKQLIPTKKQKIAPKPESEEKEEDLEDDEENDVNHGVELHDDEDEDIDDDDDEDDEDGEEFDEDEDEDDENDSEQDAADAEMVEQLKTIQKKQPTTAVPKKADLLAKAASSSTTASSSSSSNSTVTPTSNSSSPDNSAEPDHSDVTFQSLGVTESLCEACLTLGWKKPSDIQRESLPYALAGRDIIGLAETGSGE